MKDYFCNRCMYDWNGQPICPMCNNAYTHMRRIDPDDDVDSPIGLKAIQNCIDDTRKHQDTVKNIMLGVIGLLNQRAQLHDASKLWAEEIEGFVKYTPKLKTCEYGSDEYKQYLKELKPYLEHHYKHNRHHPERALYTGLVQEETWKEVVGFEEYYQISNWGRVKTIPRESMRNGKPIQIKERFLTAHKTPKGYYRVQLQEEGKPKYCLVHKLVADAFIPNHEELSSVIHTNNLKTDNYVENLEWSNSEDPQVNEKGLQKYKYVVHCVELNLTTIGAGEMSRQLAIQGYTLNENVILSSIYKDGDIDVNDSSDLHFIGYVIEEHQLPQKNLLETMNLVDIVEMLCDWKAASTRHREGDILKSIEIQRERFCLSDDLYNIMRNTLIEIIDKKE